MDYLVAKTKGKRGAFYKVLSDKTTFEDIPDFASSREYDDEYKLQDDEWFVVNQLSQQIYCMDFVKNNFVATNYSFMPKDKYGKIDFIVSVQDEGNVFVFQKITYKIHFIKSQKCPGDKGRWRLLLYKRY